MVQSIELNQQGSAPVQDSPYLSLELDQQTSIFIELKYIRETLILPVDRIAQIPNVHPCLVGLVEHRGSIFWVVDLPQLFSGTGIDTNAIAIHVAVLQVGDLFLGLGVYRIGKVQTISQDRIYPLDEQQQISPLVKPLIQGFVVDRAEINLHQGYLINVEAMMNFDFNLVS
ncbi:MAG: chemotaxis protein CheW [Pseudanabaenaceae cyanobacterium bins.39]|nr:chemotaxis protein CheW [Pseudanabaenaceae cyanobacterium bins.39]